MLDSDMKEKCSKMIQCDDIDSKTMMEFLRFVYTGTAYIDEIEKELFYAAHKYDVSKLKRICELSLLEKLSVENAMEILILADLFDANELEEECLKLIIE